MRGNTGIENVISQDVPYSDSALDTAPAIKCDTDHSPLHGVTTAQGETASRSLSALLADNNPRNTRHLDPVLPVVTTDNSGYVTISRIDSSDVGIDSSSNEPPTLSTIEPLQVVTDDHSLSPPDVTPISITPLDDTSIVGYSEQIEYAEEPPEVVTTSSDVPDSTTKSGPLKTSLPKHVSASRYYEVLTPEGDVVIHISHVDIMSKNCSVTLENLSKHDIKELQEINKGETPETESTSDNQSSSEQKTTSDTDWVPSPKKKVMLTNRP